LPRAPAKFLETLDCWESHTLMFRSGKGAAKTLGSDDRVLGDTAYHGVLRLVQRDLVCIFANRFVRLTN
jgi:hypothetical protein